MRVDYVGYALAVLSLIYAYYLHRKGIRIKEPVYSIKSVNVISDYASSYANLAVTYKGEKVENFTVSKVIFFNRGDVTLNRDDINTLNHLKMVSVPSVSIWMLQFYRSTTHPAIFRSVLTMMMTMNGLLLILNILTINRVQLSRCYIRACHQRILMSLGI